MRIAANGQVFFIDRIKDNFKNRGLQVSPSEISSSIRRILPGIVHDCVVIGVPAPPERARVGEEAWAFVIVTPSTAAKLKNADRRWDEDKRVKQTIKDAVAGALARHKWIEEVRFADEFPRGPSNKILVRQLREEAMKETKLERIVSKL